MSDNISIRKCEAKDESAYIKLNLDFMNEVMEKNPYWVNLKLPSLEEFRHVFKEALEMPEKIRIYVAEVDGKIVAYANAWEIYSIWSRGMALSIDDIYVSSTYRKKGIGTKMMEYLITCAKSKGFKRVQLHAELDNFRAHELYRQLGFDDEGMQFFMKKI